MSLIIWARNTRLFSPLHSFGPKAFPCLTTWIRHPSIINHIRMFCVIEFRVCNCLVFVMNAVCLWTSVKGVMSKFRSATVWYCTSVHWPFPSGVRMRRGFSWKRWSQKMIILEMHINSESERHTEHDRHWTGQMILLKGGQNLAIDWSKLHQLTQPLICEKPVTGLDVICILKSHPYSNGG